MTAGNLWWDGIEHVRRPPLVGDIDVDVAIVGAGFTGLWAAFYLRAFDPHLRVMVVEAEHTGFGASGRNGGWCSAELPVGLPALARRYSRDAALRMAAAAQAAVVEVGKVVEDEEIDCDWAHDGAVSVARNIPQENRLKQRAAIRRDFGLPDLPRLDRGSLAIAGLRVAAFNPDCAAVQPAKLVLGLADAVERRGAQLVEGTRAIRIEPGRVVTDQGDVRASVIVRATEGYTEGLHSQVRRVLPLFSRVVATEPIPAEVWDEIGWPGRAVMADLRHHFPYLQRSADDRLVIGGRALGYSYRSRLDAHADAERRTWETLRRTVSDMFPALTDVAVTHQWSGVLGVYRDWEPRVSFDAQTGLATAGGYAGDGVALSNLAGRTVAALITASKRPEANLCWVGPPARRWEREPARYLAVSAVTQLARSADAYEDRRGRPARVRSRIVGAVLG